MKIQQGRFYGNRVRLIWICSALAFVTAHMWAQSAQPAIQAQANPGDVTLRLDPAQSKLNWTLGTTLHTVHGTF
ncbi:MAG: hypothetical protein WBD72_18970, partial [Candidatus Acidiferrum sp.]